LSDLASRSCVPCRGGIPPLAGPDLDRLERELGNGWAVVDGHHLEKTYRFPDFRTALGFVNRVGEMCEAEGHHGELLLAWGRVRLTVWTHKIDGLTESDFVWAAKADRLEEAS
jgi:4a-hydroxytetrahydrobiopterin dehydratase